MTTSAMTALRQYEAQILNLRREEVRKATRRVMRYRLGSALSVAVSVGAFVWLALTILT